MRQRPGSPLSSRIAGAELARLPLTQLDQCRGRGAGPSRTGRAPPPSNRHQLLWPRERHLRLAPRSDATYGESAGATETPGPAHSFHHEPHSPMTFEHFRALKAPASQSRMRWCRRWRRNTTGGPLCISKTPARTTVYSSDLFGGSSEGAYRAALTRAPREPGSP